MKERLKANKKRVLEIYGGECANKDDPRFDHRPRRRPTIHHIVFKSEGGGNNKGNLIALCKNCHSYLHKVVEQKGGEK